MRQALAESLRSNVGLGAIYLRENNIGVKGGTALAGALRHNRALSVVDLAGNRLDVAGGTAMAETIRRNRALTELSLYGNAIGVAGGRAIAECAESPPTPTLCIEAVARAAAGTARLHAPALMCLPNGCVRSCAEPKVDALWLNPDEYLVSVW